MAHQNQITFCKSVKQKFPELFQKSFVLDIGSLDINGNNQYLFEDCNYIGIDLMPGKNVDIVTTGHELALPNDTFDVIISTECFEHDRHYEKTLLNIVRLLKPGGLFLFSCATTGRPEHGTARTTPQDAPFLEKIEGWSDYYKNLTESDIRNVIDIESTFSTFEFSTNLETKDLYFYGIKAGIIEKRDDYSFLLNDVKFKANIDKLKSKLVIRNGINMAKNSKIDTSILQKDNRLSSNSIINSSNKNSTDYSGVLVASQGEHAINGGLFLFNGDSITTLDRFPTLGICSSTDYFLRAKHPYSLCIYKDKLTEITDLTLDDIHDVLAFDGYIYVVGTMKNQIIKFDFLGNELERWIYGENEDERHLNCLGVWNNKVVFSAFGDFTEKRGYKGNTADNGYVEELISGKRLITGLNQPHSLVPFKQNLLVANSGENEIREYSLNGDLIRVKKMEAYVRGISVSETKLFLGLSRSRGVDVEEIKSATLIELDLETWEESKRITLPVKEIYAIEVIKDNTQLVNLTSMLLNDLGERYNSDINNYKLWLKERDEHFAGAMKAIREFDENALHRKFDAKWYLTQYPSAAVDEISAEHHFFSDGGLEEGRLPSPNPYIFLQDVLSETKKNAHEELNYTQNQLIELSQSKANIENELAIRIRQLEQEKSLIIESSAIQRNENESLHIAELTLLRNQLETNLTTQVEREKTFSQQLLQIQEEHAKQLLEFSENSSNQENTYFEKITQLRQQLETNLTTQVEREKEFSRQLLDIHKNHSQQLNGQNLSNTAKNDMLTEQLTQFKQQVESSLIAQVEREKEFSQQLLAIQAEYTLNQNKQNFSSIERERVFSQNLIEVNADHLKQINEQNNYFTNQEQKLNTQIADLEQSIQELTQNHRAIDVRNIQTINQLNEKLENIRKTRSWRWTHPFRQIGSLISGSQSECDSAQSTQFSYNPDSAINREQGLISNQFVALQTQIINKNMEISMSSSPENIEIKSLKELLSFYDEPFIYFAYQVLLDRTPDIDGLKYYLAKIRYGVPKIEILAQIASSPECKSKRIKFPELTKEIRQQNRKKLPIIGALFRIGSNDQGHTLRAIENKLYALEYQIQNGFSNIAHQTVSTANLINQENSIIETEIATPAPRFTMRTTNGLPVVILTVQHCMYVAHEIQASLLQVNIPSKIITARPDNGYEDVPHIVICPQIFEQLPGFYVAFQMEQSVSSRWFTDDYFRTLENSFAILDYSINNIEFLQKNGLSRRQINYLPIGYIPNYRPEFDHIDPEYDVLFYGDINNDRRKLFIEEISKHCSVKVINDTFGPELHSIMARAKLVINIHYYAGALLETTRIWECLSLNKLVISERSSDKEQHSELNSVVDFVEVDDITGMVARINHWLKNDSLRIEKVDENKKLLEKQENRFEYFFHRFLLSTGNINFDEFWEVTGKKIKLSTDRICLSLPEDVVRINSFNQDNHYGFELFNGLRHSQGWLGCALSYKYMIMLARQQGLNSITICEDDVEFPTNFLKQWEKISKHITNENQDWDIFSGLLAHLSEEAKVLNAYKFNNHQFVTVDKLISTVFNVYNNKVYDVIASWDPNNHDVQTNTIDRYLESHAALKVLTTSPFLVGHKEDQQSTIWGFQNTQYKTLISASKKLLERKVKEFNSIKKNKPILNLKKLLSQNGHIEK